MIEEASDISTMSEGPRNRLCDSTLPDELEDELDLLLNRPTDRLNQWIGENGAAGKLAGPARDASVQCMKLCMRLYAQPQLLRVCSSR